jgi:integrase
MKGHIYQRAKGSWPIVYDLPVDTITGKRRQKSQTVKGTKRDAERALREILLSLEQGSYIKPNKLTLGEWLDQWCESFVVMNTTPRTYVSYRPIIDRHLKQGLGSIALSRLEPQQIQAYYADKLTKGRVDGKGSLSNRSVLYHHRILSKALDQAVKMGLVVRNVAKLITPPRVARKTINVLDADEASKLLDISSETIYYPLFSTLLYTGLRRGEAIALRWKNIDLLGLELHVVESAYRIHKEFIITEPKTLHSKRAVSLSPSLAALLREYREDQELMRKQMGNPLTGEDFVFSWPDGRPLDPDVVTKAFHRIAGKAGLKNIMLHDLRHTHATLMLKAGVHPKVVSERLGHANIGITLDTYSHVLPGLQEAAAERFDRIFEKVNKENLKASVSKMLANDGGFEREPPGDRTLNLLIKSQLLYQLS